MIYLLSGLNTYLSTNYLEDIKKKYLLKNPFIDIKIINADECKTIDEIFADFEMQGFFSTKKLLIIKRLFQNNSKILKENVTKYLESSKEKDFIFWEDTNIDKRTQLYKKISVLGEKKEFENLKSYELANWIVQFFKNLDIKIDNSNAEKLIFKCGTNQMILFQELNKLHLFLTSNKKNYIEEADIQKVISFNRDEDIWNMIDSISMGQAKLKENFMMIDNFIREPSDYPLILSLLARQLRIFYLIIINKEKNPAEIASKTDLHPFVIKKNFNIALRLGLKKIQTAYEKLYNLDLKIKEGIIEPKLGLNLFILTLL